MTATPLFKTRAFQLDLGRQPESLETLKRNIEYGARFGFNQCHLYLENSLRLDAFGPAGRGLDKAETADLIAFADKLGIEVVPSLNLLGHAEHFLAHDAFRDLDEVRDGPRQPWQRWHNGLCPSLPRTREWAAEVIAEVSALFPSPHLHVGLDETWMLGSCKLCRKREEEIGLGGLFAEYAAFLNDQVKTRDRRMWMWADMCFYYEGVLERLPREIVMVDWHYERIDERPVFSFRNWRGIDSVRILAEAGFTVVAAGGCNIDNVRTFSRYVAGLGVDTFLVTQWEGTLRYPESTLRALCEAGGFLSTGAVPDWKTIGERLLPEQTESERRAFLLACRGGHDGTQAAVSLLRERPENLLYRVAQSDLLGRFVAAEAQKIRREAGLTARTALRRPAAVEDVVAPLRARLATALEAGREWLEVLRDLATRYREEETDRGLYSHARRLVDDLTALQTALTAFHQEPGAATFPTDPVELVLEFVIVDSCAHACRVESSADGKSFETVYDVCALPAPPGGTSEVILPLPRAPHAVRISIGGYARVGLCNVRCRTIENDILPLRVLATEGEVYDADHLLEWDRKAAFFNEADVSRKWLRYRPTEMHSVLLELT